MAKSTSSREGLGGCHLTSSTDAENQSKSWDRVKAGSTVVRASAIVKGSAIVVIPSAVVIRRRTPLIGAAVSTSVCPPKLGGAAHK